MTWPPGVPAAARSRLPLAFAVAVVIVGSLTFVVPRMSRALAARSEAVSLEGRKANLRLLLQRTPVESPSVRAVAGPPGPVSAGGGVPATIEALARLASSLGHPPQASSLTIEAGQPRAVGAGGAANGTVPLDPRWVSLVGPLEYTPIAVTFEATYERLGLFLWRLHDLPTLVDVGSVDVERSASLLKVKLTLFALHQRGGMANGALNAVRIPASAVGDAANEPVWSRDPFVAIGVGRRATGQSADAGTPVVPDPVITSILYAADRRLAVIDRRTVRIGDAIAAGVIADIQPNAVLIRLPSGRLRRVELARPLTPGRSAGPGTSRSR